ncbi:MAG: hypothetical protein L3J79_06970 [Candidatus Marinimicrobia bacterium]|nr:hypothetical protein [Candidatus Neomarinimicrobiota bacterium]
MPRYSLSSFPSEYVDLYIKATSEIIKFDMTFNQACTRRAAFHSLRAAMNREGHPAAQVINSVVISIFPAKKQGDGSEPAVLTLGPRDADFLTMIKRALPDTHDTPAVYEEPTVLVKTDTFNYLDNIIAGESDDELEVDD